jgi:hypothetical protein
VVAIKGGGGRGVCAQRNHEGAELGWGLCVEGGGDDRPASITVGRHQRRRRQPKLMDSRTDNIT